MCRSALTVLATFKSDNPSPSLSLSLSLCVCVCVCVYLFLWFLPSLLAAVQRAKDDAQIPGREGYPSDGFDQTHDRLHDDLLAVIRMHERMRVSDLGAPIERGRREGEREGERVGEREGERVGEREGERGGWLVTSPVRDGLQPSKEVDDNVAAFA